MGMSEFPQNQFVRQSVLRAETLKSSNTPARRNCIVTGTVDVQQNITVAFRQKSRRLITSHIIIRVDAAYIFVLPLDCHNGNRQLRQLSGRNRMTHNNQAFYLIGKKLLYITPLRFFLFVTGKNEKLVSEIFISGQDAVQHFRIKVIIQIRNDNPHKLCFAVGKNTGNFIFLIIQRDERIRNNLLILKRQRIDVVKITGNRCFGKIRIFCNVVKRDILFSCHAAAPPSISETGIVRSCYLKSLYFAKYTKNPPF